MMLPQRGVVGLLAALALFGCAEDSGTVAAPDLIVVSEFSLAAGMVTLDPSFGFSLYRGQPGVPERQRATAVANAVGFLVTDTITERLRAAGYQAASTTDPNPRLESRALVVQGVFRQIDEGHRRQVGAEDSSVVVDVQVRAAGPSAGANPVLTLHVDSRRLPATPVARGRDTGVNVDAARVGAEIARAITDLARYNHWTVGR